MRRSWPARAVELDARQSQAAAQAEELNALKTQIHAARDSLAAERADHKAAENALDERQTKLQDQEAPLGRASRRPRRPTIATRCAIQGTRCSPGGDPGTA